MEFSEEADNKIDINEVEKNVIASIFDTDGKYYLIDKKRKIYLKTDDCKVVEITDEEKITEIFNMYRPGKTDVI